MKTIVLCSGGIDSVTALYHAHREYEVLGALGFHYGSKHNDRELPEARHHADKLGIPFRVVALDFMDRLFTSHLLRSGGEIPEGHYAEETMKQTVVPFRNGILLSIAAGYAESAGADGVVIAAHSGDHAVYPDCREPFMDAMGRAMATGTYAGIRLLRPFIALDKTAIVRIGTDLQVDYARTWSCYKGRERHCGVCGTCVERREAFQKAAVPDPTEYEQTPPLPEAPGSITGAGSHIGRRPDATPRPDAAKEQGVDRTGLSGK